MQPSENQVRIGVFCPVGDRVAGLVLDQLERLAPNAARRFDLDGTDPVSIDGDGVSWGAAPLTGLEAAYVRGFRFEDPVTPRPKEQADWSLWQPSYVLDQQRYSFDYSLLCRLEATGAKLYNGVEAHLLAAAKFAQLQRLRQQGVAVPAMLCGNDDGAVGAFCEAHEKVLWRTGTGRCAWQLFLDKQRRFLVAPSKPPVILAALAAGRLLRAFVFDGRPVLGLETLAPECENLEFLEACRWVDVVGDADVLRAAARAAGANWCQILYVSTDDGPVVYDVDPDPVLEELPAAVREYLTAAVAHGLLGRLPELAPTKALREEAFERQSLFLRRMLRILFRMERSKYEEPE
jgi:hypothetical protein